MKLSGYLIELCNIMHMYRIYVVNWTVNTAAVMICIKHKQLNKVMTMTFICHEA